MIFVLFFAMAITGALCWLSAWVDDHKPTEPTPPLPAPTPTRGWPNGNRACRRAVNQ